MAVEKHDSMAEFKIEDEYPLELEAAGAYKTETYNQWVYDPIQDVGLNIWFASGQHGGGQPFPNFMSTVIVFLQKEKFTGNTKGAGNHARGIAAGNAFLTMIEPFKRWKVDYLGLLHGADAKVDNSLGIASRPQLARLDLSVDITTPPIEQGSQGDRGEVASSGTVPRSAMRYEQLCRITGLVQIGSRTTQVNAFGMRSHRRNSASIYDSGAVGHTWATALFPSGRGFHLLAYQIQPAAKVGFLYGHYFDGERYHEAVVTRFPLYSGLAGTEQSRLEMRVGGKLIQVDVESLPPLCSDIPPQGVKLTRSPARFILEGEVGGGVLERSLMPQFQAGGDYRDSTQGMGAQGA
jgi:hypothetical protein